MNQQLSLSERLISDFIEKLGFSPEEASLYRTLLQHGPLTFLEASRKSGLERTRIYRMVDPLLKKGLIREIPQHKHTQIEAIEPNAIELMVRQKEAENTFLLQSLANFTKATQSLSKPFPGSNAIYYRGVEGIKQQTWNMLRCTTWPFRTYSYRFWNDIFGDSFTLKLNSELIDHHFKVHDLYSDEYIAYKKDWLLRRGRKPPGDWSWWNSRYLPEKTVKIHMNMDVYNNVVSYYYWQENEIFGVEIESDRVAHFHRQIHDVLWKMAKPLGHFNWSQPWKR